MALCVLKFWILLSLTYKITFSFRRLVFFPFFAFSELLSSVVLFFLSCLWHQACWKGAQGRVPNLYVWWCCLWAISLVSLIWTNISYLFRGTLRAPNQQRLGSKGHSAGDSRHSVITAMPFVCHCYGPMWAIPRKLLGLRAVVASL